MCEKALISDGIFPIVNKRQKTLQIISTALKTQQKNTYGESILKTALTKA